MESLKILIDELFDANGNNMVIWKKIENQLALGKDSQLFVSYIKSRLLANISNDLSLDLLDFAIDKKIYGVTQQIATKDFLETFLTIMRKDFNAPVEIQKKILYLIQKWAFMYKPNEQKQSMFPCFYDFYQYLLSQNIFFPPIGDDTVVPTYKRFINDFEQPQQQFSNIQNNFSSFNDNKFGSNMSNNTKNNINNFVNINATDNGNYPLYTPDFSGSNSTGYSQNFNTNNQYNNNMNFSQGNTNNNMNFNSQYNPYSDSNNYGNTEILPERVKKAVGDWVNKLNNVNFMIDQGSFSIYTHSGELRKEIEEIKQNSYLIDNMIQEFSSDMKSLELFKNLKIDIKVTLFRYEQLVSGRKVERYVSTLQSNPNFQTYYGFSKDEKQEKKFFDGDKIKSGLSTVGNAVKKPFVYSYEKIKSQFSKDESDSSKSNQKNSYNYGGYDYNNNLQSKPQEEKGWTDSVLDTMKGGFKTVKGGFKSLGNKISHIGQK